METYEEQRDFFAKNWPELKAALERDGAPAAVSFIDSFDSDLERRVLFVHARAGLVMDDWEGKSFDAYIEVCDAGTRELLRQAEAADDPNTAAARQRGAHIISYNLAADLADCWPGDDKPRSRAHFERGLQAAADCLRWCEPDNSQGLSIDWWVKGMHELSLGRPAAARDSWQKSLDYARQAATAQDLPTEVSADAGFGVILGSGYAGIGRVASGEPEGGAQLEEAMSAFAAQLEDETKRDDAQFGIDQLEKVSSSYLD